MHHRVENTEANTEDALGSGDIRRYVGNALTRYRVADYKGGFATSDLTGFSSGSIR